MSALDHRIDRALDALKDVPEGFVDHMKLKAAGRPWTFTAYGAGLGFVIGLVVGIVV